MSNNKYINIYPGCSILKCDNLNKDTNIIINFRLCFYCDVYKAHQVLNNQEPYCGAVDNILNGGC